MREANTFERDMPTFFRDSSNTWTASESDVMKFYLKCCDKLFAIFNNDHTLAGLVYCEPISDGVTNVHFDMRRKTDISEITLAIAGIRDYQFQHGIRIAMAFILKRNRGIERLLKSIGFKDTYLEMKQGHSHGKVLTWKQLCISPDSFNRWEVIA